MNSNYPAKSAVAKNCESVTTTYHEPISYGSGSYGSLESSELGNPSYPSSLYGLGSGSGSYGYIGSNGYYGSLHAPVIPTSYASYIPQHHCGVNIAQQIIHKPIITELQEVIHKPIISEVQEIINKPVISEVQQIIHKPLYTEHIGLGPSYQGYLKHIIKHPIYQKPCKQFVHQPITQAGTIHLADEYEHAHSIYQPGTYSNGFSAFPVFTSGMSAMQQNSLSEVPVSNVASYQPIYSQSAPVSTNYSPLLHTSTPLHYGTIPSIPTSFGYPSYGCGTSGYKSKQQTVVDDNSYVNFINKLQPKAAEQIMYDEFQPYNKQQFNDNQQNYNNLQFSQQLPGLKQQERSNEDSKIMKMNVDAIIKQIEKNPEMKKQLIKIITESMYVTDQMAEDKKLQDKAIKSPPPSIKFD